MQHLTTADAAFLHLETPETPMHVGSLMLFDLPAGYAGDFFEDVRAMLAARLHLSKLFTRKLAQMPFDLADPVWIDNDDTAWRTAIRPGRWLSTARPTTAASTARPVSSWRGCSTT